MRKRTALVIGVAAITAALLLSTGGTYAYFAANAVSQPGHITAGDLRIKLDEHGPTGDSGPIGFSGAVPGGRWPASAEETYSLVITNTGSVSAEVNSLDLVVTSDGQPDLSDALEIRYSITAAKRDPIWARGSGWIAFTSGSVLDALPRSPAMVRPGRSSEVHFQLRWPDGDPEYDNHFQGAGTEFMFNIGLGQV